MSASSLSVVPAWRLGTLLQEARQAAGTTLDDLAARTERFTRVDLAGFEQGDRSLSDDDVQALVELYGVEADALVPGRTDLIVDLDHCELATAGRTQPLAGSAPTPDEVLAAYLSLVYTLRSTEPGTRVPLRQADLDVLAQALLLATPEIEHRLVDLMVHASPEVRRQAGLLRTKVLVPAAGVLLALTAAGALVVATRSHDTSRPPAADVSVPPEVVVRGADGPAPAGPVVQGEGVPAAALPDDAVQLGDAQVAVRGPDGQAVQGDVAPSSAPTGAPTTTAAP